jgi:flagellar M-ring protein FliF
VAVLVDGTRTQSADGTSQWQPRDETELADLRELVTSAAGIDADRGDVLTLKSMEFQPIESQGQLAEATASLFSGPIDLTRLIQMGLLALIALGLGGLVVRPLILQGRGQGSAPDADVGPVALPSPGITEEPRMVALNGVIDDDDTPPLSLVNPENFPDTENQRGEAITRLRRLIETRQQETVEILRGWLERQEGRG